MREELKKWMADTEKIAYYERQDVSENYEYVERYYIRIDEDGQERIWQKSYRIQDGVCNHREEKVYYGADWTLEDLTAKENHKILIRMLKNMARYAMGFVYYPSDETDGRVTVKLEVA